MLLAIRQKVCPVTMTVKDALLTIPKLKRRVTRAAARAFLAAAEEALEGMTDSQVVRVMRIRLCDTQALDWWNALEQQAGSSGVPLRWTGIRDAFRTEFIQQNSNQATDVMMKSFKRGAKESVSDYSARVVDYGRRLKLPFPYLRRMYQQGCRHSGIRKWIDDKGEDAKDLTECVDKMRAKGIIPTAASRANDSDESADDSDEDSDTADEDEDSEEEKASRSGRKNNSKQKKRKSSRRNRRSTSAEKKCALLQAKLDKYEREQKATAFVAALGASTQTMIPSRPPPASQVNVIDSFVSELRKVLAPMLQHNAAANASQADWRTDQGTIGCGRCNQKGHGQLECPRQRRHCSLCKDRSHIPSECSKNTGRVCYNCGGTGHYRSDCRAQACQDTSRPQAALLPDPRVSEIPPSTTSGN